MIPAFAVRWIKETSPTPYLRNATTPNLRKQDVGTTKLLCQECETRFSREEGIFAEKIFNPYVSEELDEKGCGRGRLSEIDYGDWLLRFALSLQWRVLVTRQNKVANESVLAEIEQAWRQFLLGERPDSGVHETHMLFLQSLGGAVIPDGLKLGRRVNSYLLRSVDATTVASDNNRKMGIYSKIGPIAFFTSVKPSALKGNSDSKLHMRGSISVGQRLSNAWLNHFIFITRPNEIYRELSEKQLGRMAQDVMDSPERALNSMSFHVLEVDFELERDR